MGAQRGQVVAVQVGAQTEAVGELGEPLERGPLVAGRAGDLHERRRVGGQRSRVDHGVASSAAGSASWAACECSRRTALVSARA
jgi:hypothetical protein